MGDSTLEPTTVAQGVDDNALRWTCYPVVRPRSKQAIHFSRHYLPGCELVSANDRQVPRQRGNQKGRLVPQTARRRIEAVRHSPTDWAITDDEVMTVGRSQRKPAEAWKPPDLKVVGLHVDKFQKVRWFGRVGNPPVVK
jgi:hypothetical protein